MDGQNRLNGKMKKILISHKIPPDSAISVAPSGGLLYTVVWKKRGEPPASAR